MIQTRHAIETIGLIGLLIARLDEYEERTGMRPTLIRLGENHRRKFREEARLLTTHDTLSVDSFAGVRIVSAKHPDDFVIESATDE